MENKTFYTYITTNKSKSSVYVGVTSDLKKRIYQHKTKTFKGFTSKYKVDILVYYEETNDFYQAAEREKQLKKWRREKKNALVETINKEWKDLSEGWYDL